MRARRSRARLIPAGILLLLLAELVVLVEVGHLIGGGWVLLALLAIEVLGIVIVRREGRTAWRSLNQSLVEGRPPSRRLADSALIMLAGLLLVFPGFVSDVVAVLLLLPPVRALARRPLERALARAAANRVTVVNSMYGGGAPGWFGGGPRGGTVVTGEVIDDPNRPRRSPEQ